ncbi:MAG: beta-ketoacyl synthase N-terminal-like domain-containing protein [Planctomycetota bacterium]
MPDAHHDHSDAIAIVGMACRLPGADDLAAYWHNIEHGVESVRFCTEEQLIAAGEDPALLADPRYVPSPGAVLERPGDFDAAFFGMSPSEAALLDPQHRVFLECAHEVLEHAGYDPERFEGLIGLFAGAGRNHYLLEYLIPQRAAMRAAGPLQVSITNEKDFVPLRVAYLLDLRGPCVAVQTACSTSLVATHLACQSLLGGECDLALAGGVSITSLHDRGYLGSDDGIFSRDGHCRPFDADASGMVAGNGAGLVALRRLDDALADGDTIHAVLLGSALNNDGSAKVGFVAPGVAGQRRVIRDALAVADVDPRTIGYVEAHGTGTPLGDMIEVAALTDAFRDHTDDRGFCGLGTVKGNIGHTNCAAGIAGLLKAVLALRHGVRPPAINYSRPNPEIDLEGSPFYISGDAQPWPADATPRRACVHALAIGGTNAHVVLEQAPPPEPSKPLRDHQLLLLSAQTPTALDRATDALAQALRQSPAPRLADVAFTLQVGRRTLPHRRIAVGDNAAELAAALEERRDGIVANGHQTRDDRSLAFAFPGRPIAVDVWHDLEQTEPAFRDALDRCADAAATTGTRDLRELLRDPTRGHEPLAIFALEYALAQLWRAWGVKPVAAVGRDVGEVTAACVAGAVTLDEAIRIAAALQDELGPTLAALEPAEPDFPCFSAVTGQAASGKQWGDPTHWAVDVDLFEQAKAAMLEHKPALAIEIGVASGSAGHLRALGELWLAGGAVDFASLHYAEQLRRVPLPTYPFERTHCWVDPGDEPEAEGAQAASWQRAVSPSPCPDAATDDWVILADTAGLAEPLRDALARHGAKSRVATEPDRAAPRVIDLRAIRADRAPAALTATEATQRIIVTDALQDVLDGEVERPERALGVPLGPGIRWVDVQLDESPSGFDRAAAQIAVEALATTEAIVAYRGSARWTPAATPLGQRPGHAGAAGTCVVLDELTPSGLAVATELVAQGWAVTLVSRGPLPPPDSAALQRVAALREGGATVSATSIPTLDAKEFAKATGGGAPAALVVLEPPALDPATLDDRAQTIQRAVADGPIVAVVWITPPADSEDAARTAGGRYVHALAGTTSTVPWRALTWDGSAASPRWLGDALAALLAGRCRHALVPAVAAAPAPTAAGADRGEPVELSSPTEERVASVWREVLEIDRVGPNDSFFEIGGRSITALRVVQRLHDDLGVELSVRQLFEAPTVAELAKEIEVRQFVADQGEDAEDDERDELEI